MQQKAYSGARCTNALQHAEQGQIMCLRCARSVRAVQFWIERSQDLAPARVPLLVTAGCLPGPAMCKPLTTKYQDLTDVLRPVDKHVTVGTCKERVAKLMRLPATG